MNRWERFRRILFAAAGICACGVLSADHAVAFQGDANPPVSDSCRACHACDKPTAKEDCLRPCLRERSEDVAKAFQQLHGPDLAILDELEERYLPVPFDHKGHAKMARMTRGCAVCHHFTPEGTAHPACKSCHQRNHGGGDIRKPGLKGAYHRQCLNCHREWSHATACEICHQPKTGLHPAPTEQAAQQEDDIMGRMHPPIPEPNVTVFETKYKAVPGTRVLFRHKEHIHRFGFTCAECHHEDSCSRCHEENKSTASEPKTLAQHHNPCAQCHDTNSPEHCDHCHLLKGQPDPPRFDHAQTGWPLSGFHKSRDCRACHTAIPYAKLPRDCNACHSAWARNNFNHAVTGQRLDQHHADANCEDCHVDREFARPPTCDACHEEEEHIVFPTKRPGPFKKTDAHHSK